MSSLNRWHVAAPKPTIVAFGASARRSRDASIDGHDGGEAQRRDEEQTSDVPTGHARADLRHNWAAVVKKPDWTSIQHLAVSPHFLNFT